jgi:hypothetical protein
MPLVGAEAPRSMIVWGNDRPIFVAVQTEKTGLLLLVQDQIYPIDYFFVFLLYPLFDELFINLSMQYLISLISYVY